MADFYRAYGTMDWFAGPGGQMLYVLWNKTGSGKKVTIQSIEIHPFGMGKTFTPTSVVQVVRGTDTGGGDELTIFKFDSNAPTLPGGIKVVRDACPTNAEILFSRIAYKYVTTVGAIALPSTAWAPASLQTKRMSGANSNGGIMPMRKVISATQPITIRPGEMVAVRSSVVGRIFPWWATVILTVDGYTYGGEFVGYALGDGSAMFGISNPTGSNKIVYVNELAIFDAAGNTTNTPYLRVVPVPELFEEVIGSTPAKVKIYKMDSASPDLSPNAVELYQNIRAKPSGPYRPAAEGGSGTPKGCNYFDTRDFEGPTVRDLFSEVANVRNEALGGTILPDDLGIYNSHKGTRFEMDYVLREAEGLGIVNSAETGDPSALSPSAWMGFFFGIIFKVESTCVLKVNIKDSSLNPVSGARVYIEKASDHTQLMNETTDVNGYAEETIDFPGSNFYANVRIRKSTPGDTRYLPYETVVSVTSTGIEQTIIIYEDPLVS